MRVILAAVLVFLAVTPAHGGLPPVELRVEGKLPFSEEDLVELVRMRLPLAREGVRAVVRPASGDRVVIQVGKKRREARIDGTSPMDSARLVALLLLDLVTDERTPGPPTLPTVSRPPQPAPPRGLPRFRLGVATRAAFLVPSDIGVEPLIGLDVRIVGSWLWGWLEAGYLWTRPGRIEDDVNVYSDSWDVGFGAVPIRTGLSLRHGWFELRGGAVLEPYWVTGPMDDVGLLVGGTVALRGNLALGRSAVLYATAGVDLFPTRESYSLWAPDGCNDDYCGYEQELLNTSWVVPWVGLGIAFVGGG